MKEMKRGKVVLIALGIILLVAAIANIIGGMSPSDNQSSGISQSEAEQYCQDARLLGKYRSLESINIVDVDNYSPDFTDSGDHVDFSWNGSEKNGGVLHFSCTLSGGSDNIELESFAINDEVVDGRTLE